jgi:hypothetical protein
MSGKRPLEEDPTPKPPTRTSGKGKGEQEYLKTLREEAREVEKICFLENVIQLGKVGDLREMMSPGVVAELVWELWEMGFRVELVLLDQHLAPQYWPSTQTDDPVVNTANEATRLARELAIRRIFDESDTSSLLPMFIHNRDRGLAAYAWRERRLALLKLREIMLGWEGAPARLKEVSMDAAEVRVAAMEAEVTYVYCTMFMSTFGRAPIVLCRLPFKARTREVPVRSFGSLGGKFSSFRRSLQHSHPRFTVADSGPS